MPRKISAVLALATACFFTGYAMGTGAEAGPGAPAAIHSAGLPPGHPPVGPSLPEGHPPIGEACPYAGQRTVPGLDRSVTTKRAPEPLTT